ncbi:MAG: tetratricopeptide repeat protein, partial [Candidatus Hermodarchaeota archaeon]
MTSDKKDHISIDSLKKELLQAQVLYDQGQFQEALNISDRIYQESQLLNNCFLTFDALIIKATIPIKLGNLEKIPDLITQAEKLLKTISDSSLNETKQKKADFLKLKGDYHFSRGEFSESVEFQKQVLVLREKLGDKKNLAKTLSLIGDAFGLMGEIDESLLYYRRSLNLCEELNLKSTKAKILIAFNAICYLNGNFERALDFIKRGLRLSEEINHKPLIALGLNNLGGLYRVMGNLKGAMKAWEECLKITEEIEFNYMKVPVLDFIIQSAIEIGDVVKAKSYLKILEDLDKKEKTKHTHIMFLYNKALVLKQSLRAHDRAESEDILKGLIKDQSIGLEIMINVLLNLCDLLLKELQLTGYIEILDEIQHYIDLLLEITEKRQSYLFMAE